MNILYIGAFRLPNLDAAAPRVLNNAKAMREAGYNMYADFMAFIYESQ